MLDTRREKQHFALRRNIVGKFDIFTTLICLTTNLTLEAPQKPCKGYSILAWGIYAMRKIGLLFSVLIFPSCSTVTTGTTQSVALSTPGVEAAECELTSPEIGTVNVVTPAEVKLSKSQHSVRVTCRKECYAEGTGLINSTFEEMTAGNILVGGVVGVVVDASSGAMNKYDPNVQIAMQHLPGCKLKKPKTA